MDWRPNGFEWHQFLDMVIEHVDPVRDIAVDDHNNKYIVDVLLDIQKKEKIGPST